MTLRFSHCRVCQTFTFFDSEGDAWKCTNWDKKNKSCGHLRSFDSDRKEHCLTCHCLREFFHCGGLSWNCKVCLKTKIVSNKPEEVVQEVKPSVPPPGFLNDMAKRAFEPDFHLVAENEVKVGCHKAILGLRSSVFAKMMKWKEGEEGKVEIAEPEEVVKVLTCTGFLETVAIEECCYSYLSFSS